MKVENCSVFWVDMMRAIKNKDEELGGFYWLGGSKHLDVAKKLLESENYQYLQLQFINNPYILNYYECNYYLL